MLSINRSLQKDALRDSLQSRLQKDGNNDLLQSCLSVNSCKRQYTAAGSRKVQEPRNFVYENFKCLGILF